MRPAEFAPKIALLTVLFAALYGTARAQLKLTKDEDGLKGPVRSVQIFQKDGSNMDQPDSRIPNETIAYDRQGRRTEKYSGLKNDASMAGKEVYVYDPPERLKEIIHYNEQEKPETAFTITYDQEGRLRSLTGADKMSIIPWLGGVSDVEVQLTFSYTSTTTTSRSTVKRKDLPKDFPIIFDSSTTYDQNGRVLEEKGFMTGLLISRRTYIYDSKGHLIRMWEKNPEDHTLHQYLYSTDQYGNALETRMYAEPRHVLAQRTLVTYEYDSAGNWVRKSAAGWAYSGTPYQAGVSKLRPYGVTRRIITYYE